MTSSATSLATSPSPTEQTTSPSPSAGTTADLLARYQPLKDAFDEFRQHDGNIRPAWESFARSLQQVPPEELTYRDEQLQRLVSDHGITYNHYAKQESHGRPWSMDLLPIILDHREAAFLETALNQRARLLSAIRADLYGPQNLLRENALPAHFAFANPRFLRPLHGCPSEDRPVHLYAVDVARAPDGTWWVLGDRFEAGAGLGYTLENRALSSRVFPTLLRTLGVQSHQGFLDELGAAQTALAPQNRDEPRIVLLTPGPAHETYHEQSFLARNLGYALVEGTDLLVRDNRVYMKTIDGVQPVDVIVRRVEGAWCDPLELRHDSLLGVPGLVDAVRDNRVAVANSLGAGALEIAALPAFLPGLCEKLLGEKLTLPSAATWWCGQKRECQFVLDNLASLIVRPTFREGRGKAYRGDELSATGRERLRKRILAQPADFTAHEKVAHGTAPVFSQGNFHPCDYVLRVFLVGRPDGWRILPGGLARLGTKLDYSPFNMQTGGESKDVWVLEPPRQDPPLQINSEKNKPAKPSERKTASQKPTTPQLASAKELPVTPPPPEPRRTPHALSSRVADNLFWLGRYAERTENLARVLQILLDGILEEHGSPPDSALLPFFRLVLPEEAMEGLTDQITGQLDVGKAASQLKFVIRDRRNPGSLANNYSHLHRVAINAKERLSIQLWNQIQRLYEFSRVATTQRPVFGEETRRLLSETLESLAGLAGLANENMSRGEAWLFLELGRRVERITHLSRLLEVTLGTIASDEEELIRQVLTCADSGMSYRRRYLNHLHPVALMDLLLSDKTNPRSLAFQLDCMSEALEQLPRPGTGYRRAPLLDRTLLSLRSRLGLADLEALAATTDSIEPGQPPERTALKTFLEGMLEDTAALASEVESRFFAHAAPLQALTRGTPSLESAPTLLD